MISIKKHTLAPLIPFLFFSFGTFASTLMLEAGAYSSEIDQFGYATGGWYRYMIYVGLSVLQYFLIFRLISPRAAVFPRATSNDRWIIFLFAGSLAFYAIPVIYYGPSALGGLNRYEFLDLPFVDFFNIKLYIAVMAFYLGLVANRIDSPHRRKAQGLFFATIVVMIMYGEKVSGPITAYLSYFSGKLMADKNEYVSFGGLLKISIALSLFFLSIYFLWGKSVGHDAELIYNAFMDRASRQGQAWWKLDEMANLLGGANGKSVIDNLLHFSYMHDKLLGNPYIKSILMPTHLYQLHSGSFAAVYPAILYLNNNFIEFIIHALLMNTIYWIVQIAIYFYSYRGFVVYALPATCAWYAVHLRIFQSGNIYMITHINYLIGLTFFLSIMLYALSNRRGSTLCSTQT